MVSNKLPTLGDIQAQIDALTQQYDALSLPGAGTIEAPQDNWEAVNGDWTTQQNSPYLTPQAQQASLQKQIEAKRALLAAVQTPVMKQGVPPAPQSSASLSPRIALPRVGLNDLKISLPQPRA